MLAQAQRQSDALEAELRRRHQAAYRPGALARREHAEAPRFGLVRCDAGDVLLTAACDLEPHRMSLEEFLRPRRTGNGMSPLEAHVPAIAVLTTAATIGWLDAKGLLARVLLRLQFEVHSQAIVGLRIERQPRALRSPWTRRDEAPAGPAALALRTRTLAKLAPVGVPLRTGKFVEVHAEHRRPPKPLSEALLRSAVGRMRASLRSDLPLIPKGSQAQYFEHRHVDLLDTTLPASVAEDEVDAIQEALL
jgi:hypothetical protein